MTKERLDSSSKRVESFIYRLGYKAYSELKSLLKSRNIGAKIVILDKEGKSVLLVRHRYKGRDLWYLPGGGVLSWERPDEAIKREISEEIIIEIDEPVLVGIYKSEEGRKRQRDMTFLFCCHSQETVKTVTVSEIEEARFCPLNNLPDNLAPGVKERTNEAIENIEKNIFGAQMIIWGEW